MNGKLHRFCHDSMDSTFEVLISGYDEFYACQAADAVFDTLDRLETKLSKFVEYSDVGRIAVIEPGQSAVVSPETMKCLLSALWVYNETAGAFDISLGRGLDYLLLDPDAFTATNAHKSSDSPCSISLDLGGIGKGFALDIVADLLGKWNISNAFVSAGPSTVLAIGTDDGKEWSVGINGEPVYLSEMALSASGKDVQGDHIMDPRKGCAADGHEKAWVKCPSGAIADALSTAFMVMSTEEVRRFCSSHDNIVAYLLDRNGKILSFYGT